jgi:hypothetical protein
VNALRRTTHAARAAALLSLGGLALHQLRYLLAYGHDAGTALGHQGHGYLAELIPALIGLALATIAGVALARAALGVHGLRHDGRAQGRAALLYAAALLAVFWAQELSEGLLAAGHPTGLAALFSHGGWIAIPLALGLGALCSLVALGLDRAERTLGVAARRRLAPPRPLITTRSVTAPRRRPLATRALAFGLARRPPPLLRLG